MLKNFRILLAMLYKCDNYLCQCPFDFLRIMFTFFCKSRHESAL